MRIKYKRKTSFIAVYFRQINHLLGKYVQETSRAVLVYSNFNDFLHLRVDDCLLMAKITTAAIEPEFKIYSCCFKFTIRNTF
jgi:hypothetical protein